MGSGVAITRLALSASDLRCRAQRAGSIEAARRMLALALVLEERPRMEAARTCGMDRQTLRDWVHRYNAEGLRGLSDRKPPGGIPKLKAEQEAEVAAWVRAGPDLAEDGVVRWRRKDLAARIERRFGVVLAERSVGALLKRLAFRHVSVRPQHPQQDAQALEAHKENFAALISGAVPEVAKDKPLEVWWQDEARVGQQGTVTYVWAERGSRPRDLRYEWASLFGAVCPARGVAAALVLDGAGWHQPGDKLKVPDNISLLQLPPYCPELNPVENIWQFRRQNYLSHRVFESYQSIVDACCDAWIALTNAPERIRSIATRPWAKVNV
jgi:transposase